MEKILTSFFILIFVLVPFNFLVASSPQNFLAGRILLEVEQNGEAWYVNPQDNQRYFLNRPSDALNIMRDLNLGISNKDFDSFNGIAPTRLSGYILLKTEDYGKAYYVNPVSLEMVYLGRPADAFKIMKEIGLGITDTDLNLIPTAVNEPKLLADNISWGWKFSTTPQDVYNFINGFSPYYKSHALGDIVATAKGFIVFYRTDVDGTSDWGWKLAGDYDDAYNFLNRKSPYQGYPKEEIRLAMWKNKIFIFYKGQGPEVSWGWKKSGDIDDMHNFINGLGVYGEPKEGDVGAFIDGKNTEIIMFYNNKENPGNWSWKNATTIEDAYNFLNGIGFYKTPVKQAKIYAVSYNNDIDHYYIFYKR